MSDIEFEPQSVADSPHFGDIADSSTLARYWNDALPDAVNVDTIAWWLDQASKSEPTVRCNVELPGSISVTAFPEQIP